MPQSWKDWVTETMNYHIEHPRRSFDCENFEELAKEVLLEAKEDSPRYPDVRWPRTISKEVVWATMLESVWQRYLSAFDASWRQLGRDTDLPGDVSADEAEPGLPRSRKVSPKDATDISEKIRHATWHALSNFAYLREDILDEDVVEAFVRWRKGTNKSSKMTKDRSGWDLADLLRFFIRNIDRVVFPDELVSCFVGPNAYNSRKTVSLGRTMFTVAVWLPGAAIELTELLGDPCPTLHKQERRFHRLAAGVSDPDHWEAKLGDPCPTLHEQERRFHRLAGVSDADQWEAKLRDARAEFASLKLAW
ncbi:hypothetical protein HKX48_002981 [Thoreauomyces humboldtii]|nr:hypothetical protein HKX48_002981 [Thoreauomyces humboldtii]